MRGTIPAPEKSINIIILTLTANDSVAIEAWRTVLAVESRRVIGAVDTLAGHVITGARLSVTLTR